MQTKMFSPKEAGDLYGQSDATVKRHCVNKKLPATKLRNGHWIIAEDDLYAYGMSMGWTPRHDAADQLVWIPVARKGLRFHQGQADGITVCGRSTLAKAGSEVKRRDALGWGMVPCRICFELEAQS